MALIGNRSVLLKSPGRFLSGTVASIQRNNFRPLRNVYETTDRLSGIPDGHLSPSSWFLPQVAGGMSSRNMIVGSGSFGASALAVKLAQADLTGSGALEAIGGLIVQALADLTGSGGVTDANVQAFLAAVANLTGSGNISDAEASGLGELVCALVGLGTAVGSTATGVGALSADLVVTGTGLTTGNVGQAVWAAIASANNTAGTMGEKLNDAGSASNPWTEVIESGYTAAEILRLLAAVAKGDASGLESGAPVFKSIDGATDRVTATYTSGTRTVTGRDAT